MLSNLLVKLGLALIVLAMLASCASMTPKSVNSFCSIAKTITWSKSDTDQTIKEIKSHNAAYKAVCRAPS